jgi:hypothetical protein
MKKAFLILTLLIAFNFTAPNANVLSQLARHTIEFRQESKTHDLTDNELLKNKVVSYIRVQMLMVKISRIDRVYELNSS